MRFCITGGGTGGHLMIAQALVEAGVSNGHEMIFIGSLKGQDRKYFEHHSPFSSVYFLDTIGVVNQKGFGKLKAIFKLIVAFFKARGILKKHKIDIVYSVGGFSAAPASFASLSLFIPLFIHEQNAITGRLNQLLKPYAKGFVSAYDKSSPIKGYPVKEIFYKTKRVRKELKSVIFLGGSQGAKTINDLAISLVKELKEMGLHVIHQAGERDYERVKKAYEDLGVEVELYDFTKELPSLIAKADFAISRSGASTLWELVTNGCPAFFIPYPYAAGDHQYHNAKFVVDNDMGWCERESEALHAKVLEAIKHPDLEQKSQKLIQYATKDVADKMIQEAVKYVV